ncbi:hypothetical protein [Caballeronia sp. AZ7_KS35]|uniref:hypothetical protein n=1 Tax=Caballeronia sp. AZ7_KS35 TaxID=2921762 RepID=UPI0020283FF6|nr:hypothetical protein [Caballeronia sp. AZ7_KS35]
MIATIAAHQAAPNGNPDLHFFTFDVDGGGILRSHQVSVRTARVLARELASRTALDELMRAIVTAEPKTYDALVGRQFKDL